MVDAAAAPPDSWVRREVDADLATARALRRRIHGDDDPAAWDEVADRWRAVNRPYETARALHRRVEALLQRPAGANARRELRDDARGPLAESASIATTLGAIPLLRALADLAERARIPLPAAAVALLAATTVEQPATEDVPAATFSSRGRGAGADSSADRRAAVAFGLSPREQGVLAEIVAGRTNREIGRRLFISDKTVGVHVGNILAKLGVGGRVEAATVALRLGLVDDRLASTTKPGPGGPGFRGRRRGGAA
jgi:DNA-binding NarL/FixJ family response regulator